jgi:hypothetical protein
MSCFEYYEEMTINSDTSGELWVRVNWQSYDKMKNIKMEKPDSLNFKIASNIEKVVNQSRGLRINSIDTNASFVSIKLHFDSLVNLMQFKDTTSLFDPFRLISIENEKNYLTFTRAVGGNHLAKSLKGKIDVWLGSKMTFIFSFPNKVSHGKVTTGKLELNDRQAKWTSDLSFPQKNEKVTLRIKSLEKSGR